MQRHGGSIKTQYAAAIVGHSDFGVFDLPFACRPP
jgi:hypothetical protein